MATVYTADNYTVPMPSFPGAGIPMIREFAYTLTAAFVINDTIKLCKIPGAGTPLVIDHFYVDVPDLDTSTGFVCDLGDDDTAAKFVAASTVGQAVGKLSPAVNGVAGAVPVSYTAAKNLIFKVNTAATGTAATTGVIKGHMTYHYIGAPTPV